MPAQPPSLAQPSSLVLDVELSTMTIWYARRRQKGRAKSIVCGRAGRQRGVLPVCKYTRYPRALKIWDADIKPKGFITQLRHRSKGTDNPNLALIHILRRVDDINQNCLEQFRAHWECLEENNQQLWHCRPQEWKLNGCVFEKLVSQWAFSVFIGG